MMAMPPNAHRSKTRQAALQYYHRNRQQIAMRRFERYYDLPVNSITEEDDGFHLNAEDPDIDGTYTTLRLIGRRMKVLGR